MKRTYRLIAATVAALSLTWNPAVARDDEKREPGLRVGGDFYFGLSNFAGPLRRMTDGAWAAVGSQDPSVLSLDWTGTGGDGARISLGLGDMYVGSDRYTQQPVECLYRSALGAGSLTVGKHYTPFGLQEWEYETRWGAMYEVETGDVSLSFSAAYNRDTRALNSMARLTHRINDGVTVGLSAACGRGWSYSTSHAWGYGADVEADAGTMVVSAEYLEARGANGTFQFGFARVMLKPWKTVRPYVGGYYGHDVADEMGELRSGILGVEIDAGPGLVIEPGVGRTGGRNVWWIQANLSF